MHNCFPELPSATVSVPTVSAAKTQAELAMAIRSDLMRPPVFVAHPLAECTKTVTIIESTLRKDSFSVPPSRTLSEKPPPGNYCVKVDRLVPKPMVVDERQAFLSSCRTQNKIPRTAK